METNDAHAQHNKDFYKAFYRISDKVDQLFAYYQERLEKKENKKVKIEGDPSENEGTPLEYSSPFLSSSSSSSSPRYHHSNNHKEDGLNSLLYPF